jgi:hypothetical protein
MKLIYRLSIFLLLCGLMSCAPSRIVRPLKKGEDRWGANLGGPLIKFGGAVIPVPFTTISYARASTDNLTWFTALHTTSALFNNFQSEIGFCYNLIPQKKVKMFGDSVLFGLSINPVANVGLHINGERDIITTKYTVNNPRSTFFSNLKLWPQLDVNAYFSYGKNKKNFFYIGLCNWFELNSPYMYNPIKNPNFVYFSPQLGNTWNDKKGIFSATVELKYLAPNVSNQNKVVDYVRPGRNGAIGVFIGITKKIYHPVYDDD